MTRAIIWKYELKQQQEFQLKLPVGYRVVKIGHQRNVPTMWCLVDPHADQVSYRFRSVLTGEKFDATGATYLGTFLLYKGDFVGHLFALSDPVERGC